MVKPSLSVFDRKMLSVVGMLMQILTFCLVINLKWNTSSCITCSKTP
jgi:hypothetical protein